MAAKNEYGLTPQQEKFAQLVAEGKSLSDAYRGAYKVGKSKSETVNENASRVMSDAKVSARVKAMQAEAAANAGLQASEVLRQVQMLVTSDIVGICKEDGTVKLPHELDERTRAAVKSFKITKDGIEYQFWDKNSALDKAMKHLGLFEKDNGQKTSPVAEVLKSLGGRVLGPVAGEDDEDGQA